MKDWIKPALTEKIQQRAAETIDIPPNEKFVCSKISSQTQTHTITYTNNK